MPIVPNHYAEVIGDPVRHSLSPRVHRFWLNKLKLAGDYRATEVCAASLAEFFVARRQDPRWLGCNVTSPHKLALLPHLDRLDRSAASAGAVNCVVPRDGALIGHNSDVGGVISLLEETGASAGVATIIGAGGVARAALVALERTGRTRTRIIARRAQASGKLRDLASDLTHFSFDEAEKALSGAAIVINASPLGMAGADPMPPSLIRALPTLASGAAVAEMVYAPLETPLLAAARARGLRTADGLTMLIGQARRAFELIFGAVPPDGDSDLRHYLLEQ